MRKSLLVIILALLASFSANAESVSKTVAAWKAATFLQLKSGTQLQLLKSSYKTFYLFSIDGGGFIIVSADNRVQPILGYSLQSNLDMDNIPSNLKYWLDGYDMQIRSAMENDALPVHSGWQEQGMSKSGVEGYDSIIGPLLTTTWDQEPLYNNQCPLYGETRTVTGCVATAMAQVMKYWNWPDTGAGQHSYSTSDYGELSANFGATAYDWTNMPNSLSNTSSTAQINAVATLMYHCGIAVNMDYGISALGGSGAYDIMNNLGLNYPCSENAFRTYFKYSPSLSGVARINYTGDEWKAMIKNEIDHRRPILYAGSGYQGGHEFVCDGYDTNGLFHFNWGYSGSGDGYFTLSRLNPLDLDFTQGQTAVIGIVPDTLYGSSTACTVIAESADSSKGSVTGGGTYIYRDTVILNATPANGYRFLCWSNGSSVNPYPLLAHDVHLTAYFADALAENGDILSYCGSNTDHLAPFTIGPDDRIGIKLPASVLAGHKYLTAVYFYHYSGNYVVNIHCGGDNAPGPVVYTQPFQIENGEQRWNLATLDTPLPIDTNNNLWITIRPLSQVGVLGITQLGISDANWISTDNGNTWKHLNQVEPNTSRDDTSIYWLIRCVTSPDSTSGTQTPPLAFIIAPEQGNVGDTLSVEILRPTASTMEWDFGDADFSSVANDIAYLVWNTVGHHVVSATVTNSYGNTTLREPILIFDCGSPINTFPYVLSFDENDELLRPCWQIVHHGNRDGYYLPSSYITALLSGGTDEWFVSPLIDLPSDQTISLELNYSSDALITVTVELSQGGLDPGDFTTIYTLPSSTSPTFTQPISLSEHNQGNPVRIAVRFGNQNESGAAKFELRGLRISNPLGIDDVSTATLALHPNPARQTVSVTLPDPNGTLTLFDATGRQLMQRQTTSTATTLDVRTLPQGVYLLQYTSSRGTTTSRLVVQ